MLSHLYIRNFTLVDALDLELHPGLTVLTGETGAGKSILLDAIGLTLGDRANADTIRQGCDKADVCAHFNLSQRPELLQWLEEQDLAQNQDCLLRRSLSRDGRSRAFINDRPVTLQQLRQLGERLINLHGQHEHQALMDLAHHRELLDTFGQLHSSAGTVKADYQTWLGLQQDYERLQQQSDELNARYQLLSYQAEEFQQMALKEGELQSLEKQHKHLTHAEQFQHSCNALVELCSGDKGLAERLRRGIGLLQALPVQTPRVQEALGLLSSAQIQIEEANDELLRALDDNRHLDGDLTSIEQRLSSLYELARKHKIKPEALLEQQAQLELELAHLKSGDDQLALLATQITAAHARYQQSAADLSQARASAAQLLTEAVNQQLQQLAMGHASLSVVLHPLSQPSPQGAEQIGRAHV